VPELPEVEVVRLFLVDKLLNKTITKLEILTPKSFVGQPKLVEGQKIVGFSRTGKQLSIILSNQLILLVHLKMTGQLIYKGTVLGHPTKNDLANLPNKSTRLIFHFAHVGVGLAHAQEGVLYFNDQRKFGWIKLLTKKDLLETQKNLGLDIFDKNFTPKYFNQLLKTTSRPVKTVLLDQHLFAGIGNIYANDALFLAKIHPLTPANKIFSSKALKLHRSILLIMQQSISAGGSTARDNKYLRPDGTSGSNQFSFRVYQREKEPCLVCGTPIKRIKQSGRSTFFCPQCQPVVVGQKV
jgi:formamidopyrimidine-DNA glycosylase